ncbi:hypothetical protein NDU88_003454 [Pleurodeles waltl]|uniref:Uncharacterized protein n=1 Tax=Pleurodeles waltl TaxID=8319 RepID=A0AAV7Q9G2_PLEWA|nr:hypothetical protein NDU88_003454 [Pleurodeles waltl]
MHTKGRRGQSRERTRPYGALAGFEKTEVWPSGRAIRTHGAQPDDPSCRSYQMVGRRGRKLSPGALTRGQRLGRGPVLEPEREASQGLVDTQAPGVRQAQGRERLPQVLVGAVPGPLNLN